MAGGLPVPGDDEHVIYVWFDALTNYISALGYGTEGSLYRRYWSENSTRIHVIGKGILRFHAAYWPAMLLSARVELPSAIFVHGYLTAGGKKISKSLGHLTNPGELSAQIGADALRYYLLSQFRAADDGDFSVEQLRLVRDNDLADQLGNLVSRVAAMIGRYRDGRIPAPNSADDPITRSAESLLRDVDRAVESFEIDRALRRVWELVREANRHVVEQEPWVLSKETSSASQERLSTVLYNLAEVLRIVAVFSSPFIPSAAREIAKILGLPAGWERISEASAEWGGTRPGTELAPAGPTSASLNSTTSLAVR